MTGLLAAVMVVVALFCLARAFVPALRPAAHRRDLDAWHVAMATAMVLMLLVSAPQALSVVLLGLFAVGFGWSVRHLVGRVTRSAYARLGLGSAAMAAMLLPAAMSPAAAQPHSSAAGVHAHHGSADPAAAAAGTPAGLAPPSFVFALLVVLLVVVLVVRVAGAIGPRGTLPSRLDACCDAAMATAMVWMLVPLV